MTGSILRIAAMIMIAAATFNALQYHQNIAWMNWRVEVEREQWIEDVPAAAHEQMLLATHTGGSELYGHDWRAWMPKDLVDNYDK